jgi:hypothetical protein
MLRGEINAIGVFEKRARTQLFPVRCCPLTCSPASVGSMCYEHRCTSLRPTDTPFRCRSVHVQHTVRGARGVRGRQDGAVGAAGRGGRRGGEHIHAGGVHVRRHPRAPGVPAGTGRTHQGGGGRARAGGGGRARAVRGGENARPTKCSWNVGYRGRESTVRESLVRIRSSLRQVAASAKFDEPEQGAKWSVCEHLPWGSGVVRQANSPNV